MKKLLGIIFLGLLLSGNAYAECIKGDCENGYGEWRFTNSDRSGLYSGNWIKGKRTGHGKYAWDYGQVYEGGFLKGKQHGQGKTIYSDGSTYEGTYKKGKRKLGKYIWFDGDICEEYRGNKCRSGFIAKKNNNTNGNIEFTTSIGKHKNTCKELGFTPGTEKFGDCALKLIELEVAQQGNNKAAQQIQIVQQEAPYDGWMGELGLSILRGDFSRKTQQPAYRFPVQQKSVCRFQNNGFAQPTLNCTTR